jgi:hypothetical protein
MRHGKPGKRVTVIAPSKRWPLVELGIQRPASAASETFPLSFDEEQARTARALGSALRQSNQLDGPLAFTPSADRSSLYGVGCASSASLRLKIV